MPDELARALGRHDRYARLVAALRAGRVSRDLLHLAALGRDPDALRWASWRRRPTPRLCAVLKLYMRADLRPGPVSVVATMVRPDGPEPIELEVTSRMHAVRQHAADGLPFPRLVRWRSPWVLGARSEAHHVLRHALTGWWCGADRNLAPRHWKIARELLRIARERLSAEVGP